MVENMTREAAEDALTRGAQLSGFQIKKILDGVEDISYEFIDTLLNISRKNKGEKVHTKKAAEVWKQAIATIAGQFDAIAVERAASGHVDSADLMTVCAKMVNSYPNPYEGSDAAPMTVGDRIKIAAFALFVAQRDIDNMPEDRVIARQIAIAEKTLILKMWPELDVEKEGDA